MYMADVLTNFGLLYGAKEDAELEARIQVNMKIAKMKQTRIEANNRLGVVAL